IDLAYLAVPVQDLILEIPCQKSQRRNDEHNDQSQLPVQQQHCHKHAKHIEKCPEHIGDIPRHHSCDTVSIAHDTGEYIAHGRHVVVGKRQLLQVDKAGALHGLSNIHLQGSAAPRKEHNTHKLNKNDHAVDSRKKPDAVQCIFLNEIVDVVSLKQRKYDVHQRTNQVKDKDNRRSSAKRLQERKHALPDPDVKIFCIFLLFDSHAFPPSIRRSSSVFI